MAMEELLEIMDLHHLASQVRSKPPLVNKNEAFRNPLSLAEVEALYIYDQPLDLGILNLADWLGVKWRPQTLRQPTCLHTQRLWRLGKVVERLRASLGPGADWVGIYRVVEEEDGKKSLLKEAYRGAVSRGIFPLTEAFAAGSNNSTCAMTRKAKVVKDTLELNPDEPYYE